MAAPIAGIVSEARRKNRYFLLAHEAQQIMPGANHFFEGQVEPLIDICGNYVDKRLKAITEAA